MTDAELVTAVVYGAARSLGRPVDLPELADSRLGDADTATEVVAAASYHAVLPLVWRAIEGRPDVPQNLVEAVHNEYLALVARQLRLRHLVTVVASALTEAGVDYAVYKGPALARCYPDPELRAFGDLDLLIRRADLDRADTALRDAGLQGGWAGVPAEYAETDYKLPGHGAADVHWHVMREANVRAAFALDTEMMVRRAQPVSLDGRQVNVLDSADELLATATHACFDGAYRLGWLVDIAVLLAAPDFDADLLRQRAAETRTALPVQVMLDRTARALDAALPPPLTRGVWRAALSALAAARPVQRSFRQAGRGGVAFRATRSTHLRSFVALSGLLLTEGVRPLITDPQHRWRRARNRRL